MTMNRLKDLREDRDMTQVDLGREIGVAGNTITNYEKETRALTADLIHKFCDIFGVTADYLLGRSRFPQPAVSEADAELLRAYAAAPPEIREIVDTALRPYREKDAAAS